AVVLVVPSRPLFLPADAENGKELDARLPDPPFPKDPLELLHRRPGDLLAGPYGGHDGKETRFFQPCDSRERFFITPLPPDPVVLLLRGGVQGYPDLKGVPGIPGRVREP